MSEKIIQTILNVENKAKEIISQAQEQSNSLVKTWQEKNTLEQERLIADAKASYKLKIEKIRGDIKIEEDKYNEQGNTKAGENKLTLAEVESIVKQSIETLISGEYESN